MANNPIETPLTADLPENWTLGQTVAPDGTEVGLTQQHGYNYLMEKVNEARKAINALNEAIGDLDESYLPFTGGTMTGDLTLAPTANLGAIARNIRFLPWTGAAPTEIPNGEIWMYYTENQEG